MIIWKLCQCCKSLKMKLSEFYAIKKCKGGYDPTCKECRRARRRKNLCATPKKIYRRYIKPKLYIPTKIHINKKNLTGEQCELAKNGCCIDCQSKIDDNGIMAGAVRCTPCIRPQSSNIKSLIDRSENTLTRLALIGPSFFEEVQSNNESRTLPMFGS